MRSYELAEVTYKPTPAVSAMSDAERHEWLRFIYQWLTGHFMRQTSPDILGKWQQLATMFPPKVASTVTLFRLVTVPVKYANKQQFTFNPAPGKVSSWTSTLVGLDAVAGVATDIVHSNGERPGQTARLGIEAIIPGRLVLATPLSIRAAFLTLAYDYFERYKEVVQREKLPDGKVLISYSHPGYPGAKGDPFSMDEVDYISGVIKRRGGHLRQYEYIVATPPRVTATVVQIYRIGSKEIRYGNDDPHGGATKITRMKR